MKKFSEYKKLYEQEITLPVTITSEVISGSGTSSTVVVSTDSVQTTTTSQQQTQSSEDPQNQEQTEQVNNSESKPVVGLVNKLFESRQMAHVYHLSTDSFSMHDALDAYYNGILELIDEFCEVYQGKYSIIENYEMITSNVEEKDPKIYLETIAKFVESERHNYVNKDDTFLYNILDEMLALMYKTIYKLKQLK